MDTYQQRYLTDDDYLALVSEEHFVQLVHGQSRRLLQAETMAEAKVMAALNQYYEVREELEKGRAAQPIDPDNDPRCGSLVTYMTMLAVYYLHAIISPRNISETRKEMYRDALQWIDDAAHLRVNPQLVRRKDSKTGEDKDDWTMASFSNDKIVLDNNPWWF